MNLNIIIQLDLGQWDRVKSFVNLNKKGSESRIENRFSVLDSVFCSNALTYFLMHQTPPFLRPSVEKLPCIACVFFAQLNTCVNETLASGQSLYHQQDRLISLGIDWTTESTCIILWLCSHMHTKLILSLTVLAHHWVVCGKN